ncbi:MAG: hypothetical protein KDE27_05700 [Planctomycetes bacterium]|nr:hypothetical protein [Planctomycetota bacterium]
MAVCTEQEIRAFRRRHLRFGWLTLLLFAALGAVLESLHGFKVDWYLAVGNETRRLMWRLAHAHGTFLALVHIAFALTLPYARRSSPRLASACLIGASIALPLGFWLGGFDIRGGDPGVGILAVPLGVLLLLAAALRVFTAIDRDSDGAG